MQGPRFEQSRIDLRQGVVDAKTLIQDDYVQGKAVTNQQDQTQPRAPIQNQNMPIGMPNVGPRPPGGNLGFRPPGPGGGPMMRPRFMGGAPPPMFRPPINTMNQINSQQ